MRLGLLGAGRIAQRFHLPILSTLESARLTAIAEADDRARERCRSIAPEAALFKSYTDLLAADRIDAAIVCLPTTLHAQAARACFAKGLHVYLEKPLATTLADGTEVVEAWKAAGTVGQIGFNLRFHPRLVELAKEISRGSLGALVAVRSTFSSAARTLPEWKRQRVDGGGVLMDLGSHHFDVLRFLFGSDVQWVEASVRSVRTKDDSAVVQASLANGVLASLFCSLSAVEEHGIEVLGTEGGLAFDRYGAPVLMRKPARRDFSRVGRLRQGALALGRVPGTLHRTLFPAREASFRLALEAFVAKAEGEERVIPTLEDGLASLGAVVAARKSARGGGRTAPSMHPAHRR